MWYPWVSRNTSAGNLNGDFTVIFWPEWLGWVVAGSTVVGLGLWPSILLSHKQPVSVLAWLLGVTFLPVAGPLVYALFGIDRIKRGLVRRKVRATRALQPALRGLGEGWGLPPDIEKRIDPPYHGLIHLQDQVSDSSITLGNRVDLLPGAHEKFARLFEDLGRARHHIHLEYYILGEDETGRELAALLRGAADRGVRVSLLLDSLGSFGLSSEFLDQMQGGGVRIGWFHPLNPLKRRWEINLRNHRKIAVIDGKIGYLGGINLSDDYLGKGEGFSRWEDLAVRLEGPSVHTLQRIFIEDWQFTTGELLADTAYFPPLKRQALGPKNDCVVQVVPSGPDEDRGTLSRIFFAALGQARHRAWLVTPYYLPTEPFQAALESAALRGVDVRVVIPRRTDSPVVDLVGRSFFDPALRAGVRVMLYQPGMLHAKGMLVDDSWAAIGTGNMDTRSLRLNFEAAALVVHKPLVAQLADKFQEWMAHTKDARLEDRLNRSLMTRTMEALLRLLGPLL
ncbi:MAG: cardiolipin synthase [Deltaproteobacteria bacterium]|nr:cardiolipin synthase [Deltaproteobacteria bacterium]